MSRENVELHHRALDAFNRRDLDALLALMDANVEANSRLVAIEGGYHGHDGIRRWWWRDKKIVRWSSHEAEAEALEAVGV